MYFLIVIDAHSKWIEVEKVTTTSATIVIDSLRRLFARFGLPKRLVSDNGPPFSSSEFAQYLKRNGIKHTLIAPYNPSSNGAAENAVRLIKRVLKEAQLEREDYSTALNRFLFTYRNTEQSATGREPAVALLGRRLRGRLDLLRPDVAERIRCDQLRREQSTGRPLRVLTRDEPVMFRNYVKSAPKWTEGVVEKRTGPVSYTIETNNGQIHKRHINQLQSNKSRHSLSRTIDVSDSENQEDLMVKDEFFASGEVRYSEPHSPLLNTPPTPPADTNSREPRKAALRCKELLKVLNK